MGAEPASLAGRRIGLLTASASRLGGGVAEAVAAQADIVRALGGEAVVIALADRFSEADRPALAPSPLVLAAVVGPAQVGFAPMLAARLEEAQLDLLHLHGIWMYPSRAALRWARAAARPYVISPHGMLDPWITARGRWKKALARAGYERASWAAASALHALTAREARDIARESGRDDSLVIANAGPAPGPPARALREPHAAYLGRIHPKKNLAALVAGWGAARLPAAARLTIAGWGEDAHVAALRTALAAADDPSIEFVGPVHGAAKQRLLGTARWLILPSLSEGLPMVVLEAWAAATPVVMSEGCNLAQGFAAGAALECETAPDAIAAALEAAFALDQPEWLAMSEAARALAGGPFSRATIAAHWGEAYAALLRRIPR